MTDRARQWTTRGRWSIAVCFVLCWVIGLIIGGPTLAPSADAAEVTEEFGGSPTHLMFAVLVHGVAALLLVALGRSVALTRMYRVTVALAVAAGGLSLVQLAGEVLLVVAPEAVSGDIVWQSITRADGIKMIVLSGFIILAHGGRSRRYVALTIVSAAACLALTVSGIGYLTLNAFMMESATASLPLLLVWALVATAARASDSLRSVSRVPGITSSG